MIIITTPNNSNTFFVKADGADYIQCPVAEAEGIAVLRYIPVGADSVEGEIYANGTALKRMLPTTITFTAIGITAIDVFVKKHSDSTWLQVGKVLDTSGGSAQFRLLPSDFVVGDIIDLKLKDVDTDVSAISESLEILPSFTLDVYPTGAKALESPQTFSGTGLSGKELTITLTSTTGEKVVTTTPVAEEWSEDIALTTDEDGFEPDDAINVEISRTTYDQKDYGELYSVSGSIEIDDSVEPFVTGNIELDSAFDVTVDSNLEGKTVIVEAQKSGGSWVEIGSDVVTTGEAIISCTVPSTDFNANDSITVRARYGTVVSTGVGLSIIATITITGTPTTAGVEENLTGASNGLEVEGFYKLASAEDWTSAGTVSTVAGAYTIPITIADAGTYDFKVEDTTDTDGSAQADDVVVASGGFVLPINEVYSTFNITTPNISANYDCFPSEANSDEIVFVSNPNSFSNSVGFRNINPVNQTSTGYTTGENSSSHFQSACQISATKCVGMYNQATVSRCFYTSNEGYRDTYWTYTSLSPKGVGIVKYGTYLILLKSDGKLYRVDNINNQFKDVDISLLSDTSSILPVSTTIKPMTIDFAQNLLFIKTSLTNIAVIDLDDFSLVENITMTSFDAGIVHHKGRLWNVYRSNINTTTVRAFKNSND